MMYHSFWFENQSRNRGDPTINIISRKEFRMSSETFKFVITAIAARMMKQDTK